MIQAGVHGVHDFAVGAHPQEWKCHAGNGVEYPEKVVFILEMNHHVATHLFPIERIPGNFQRTHHLKGNDVKHIDVDRHFAAMHQRALEQIVVLIDAARQVVHHQEANYAGEGECEHVLEPGREGHAVPSQSGGKAEDA